MSSPLRVAVVGATGVVGTTMLELLRERSFPASEIVPFATSRSALRSGVGTSSSATPGAAPSSSRACSAESGSRVWMLTASACPIRTGTRTHVTATPIDSSSRILRVSNIILRSSSV